MKSVRKLNFLRLRFFFEKRAFEIEARRFMIRIDDVSHSFSRIIRVNTENLACNMCDMYPT